jgi:Asp-tRNA(Asn)/Glu-tRNA(Gln) amidotransferase C subunit
MTDFDDALKHLQSAELILCSTKFIESARKLSNASEDVKEKVMDRLNDIDESINSINEVLNEISTELYKPKPGKKPLI